MGSRINDDVFLKNFFQQEHILNVFLNTVLHDELPAPIQHVNYQHPNMILKAKRQQINLLKHTIIEAC